LADFPARSFLFQRFIPNDFDFRFLVLGGKVGTISKRTRQNKDDHRNNAYVGATEEEVAPDAVSQAMKDDAIAAAEVFHRQVAGVDIIVDKNTGQHYILEVNASPGITFDESVLSELPQLSRYLDEPNTGEASLFKEKIVE